MPAATLAQPLGLSTPKTNAQLPFPMFINGNEVSAYVDASTIRLRDSGMASAPVLSFEIPDRTGAVAGWLAKKQRILWYDAAGARYLFHGFVDNIRRQPIASWAHLTVDCVQLSAVLDYSDPIVAIDAAAYGGTKDSAWIQALIANYCNEPNVGAGGFVQTLNSSMPAALPLSRVQLRNAIDAVLTASNVTGAFAYVDNLGYLHTLASGDVSAPFNITDAPPPWTTAVPAKVTVEEQGQPDVEAVYVYGGTPAGSGLVLSSQLGYGSPPAYGPLRVATIDAPQATDATSRNAAAQLELNRRQNATIVTLVVTNYDGWASGQLVSVTNAALGWSAKQFTITAVSMRVLSGDVKREYTITAGTDPVLFSSRFRNLRGWVSGTPVSTGQLGTGLLGGISG